MNSSEALGQKVVLYYNSKKIGDVFTDEDLSFTEFDAWARGKCREDKLDYFDRMGREVIPCGKFLSKHAEIHAKRGTAPLGQNADAAAALNHSTLWQYFKIFGPWVLVMLLAITLAPDSDSKHTYSVAFDYVLEATGMTQLRNLLLEAYIAFLAWSIGYLFIRRVLNPENEKGAIQKYAPDAFFGGTAAATTVFLKKILVKVLGVQRT